MHNEDSGRHRPVRRVLAKRVGEHHTSNRITDLTPPPFKTIQQPLGDIWELSNYLQRESGAVYTSDLDEQSYKAGLKRVVELL